MSADDGFTFASMPEGHDPVADAIARAAIDITSAILRLAEVIEGAQP